MPLPLQWRKLGETQSNFKESSLPTTPEAIRQWVRRQPDAPTLLVCYEAGPTGYEMARLLIELGVTSEVVAPELVPNGVDPSVEAHRGSPSGSADRTARQSGRN